MKKEGKFSYVYIKEHIESQINEGKLKVGEKLPSEIHMAKKYEVSRETFRSAIRLLEEEGKVTIKRGIGTFIATPLKTIPSSLEKLTSITDIIRAASLKEGEKREKIETVACTKEWGELLGLEEGDPVIFHKRTRTADGEPVVFSLNVIPKEIVGDLFDEKHFSGSLLHFIERECNVNVVCSDAEISVPLHTDRYCQKLLIHPHTTVLLLKQVHYDEFNRPIFYSEDYLRNDVFQFQMRRKR
ncbi:GntR family transcriptional regulator [Gracilibacillus sp. S3-1-1]|uniref:GntR family transcriptional regulator n=1 Tax=Gracilibacillus pellucidus TaxID=3095368 RepID=A0ACC6M3M2_9BACI|nr:GntR family transcriptional regulator [Gracilibacillus sp. S3-1-1]MDX8045327.1 GntR family transcriptional regulator [Gracilibacillus sp. S3-1-1]